MLLLPLIGVSQELSYIRESEGIRVSEGTAGVLFYQLSPKSIDGKFERANYIHPLYGLDGAVLTEDFPADHLHHRGVFWAWHQVIVGNKHLGDSWECRKFIWDVGDVDVVRSDSSLLLSSNILWKSPDHSTESGIAIPVMQEETNIRIHRQYENPRLLEFEISLTPLVDDLKLGGSEDAKGYGGFSVRLKTPDDLTFTLDSRVVTPSETAVRAGNQVIVTGSLGKNDTPAGVAVVSQNDFDKTGSDWILRKKNSMQNAAFPGREPVSLPLGKPLLLRYSLIVFLGTLDNARVNAIINAKDDSHE
jgi:hypothetical protein